MQTAELGYRVAGTWPTGPQATGRGETGEGGQKAGVEMIALVLEPVFWQNTLPLMATILVAVGAAVTAGWISNASLTKRLDDIIARLGRIEVKLDDHGERITRMEERTSPIRRG